MIHIHLRLLRLAGGIRWYLIGTIAVGLAVTASYVVQGVLVAHVLAGVFHGGGLAGLAAPLAGVVGALAARAGLVRKQQVSRRS